MCVIDFIDHCEIIIIHFAKLKDFKNKYLKAKTFTQSVIESHNPRKLCSFNRERKPNSSLVPACSYCETLIFHLATVTIKNFKGSSMSLENLTMHPTFLKQP